MSEFGKYDVYSVAGSIYCYPDSHVLKNHFSIRDYHELKDLEAEITLVRQKELLEKPIVGRFTVNHLCRIHRMLFADIYPFAGQFRKEDIMKGQTSFLGHGQISDKLKGLLLELQSENYLHDSEFEVMVKRSAYYLAELNYIHPFREGNGRTIREFMRLLYDKNGYEVDWKAVPEEQLLYAMEESVFDTGILRSVLKQCLKKQ